MEIRPLRAELFHTDDKQMYMTNCRFSQFCERTQTLRITTEYVCVCVRAC